MFVEMATQIIAKQLVMITLQAILKALGGAGGGLGSSASNVAAYAPLAKGGTFGNGIATFANGGAFTNSIVNSPTMFKFARGGAMSTGVMGEAGPEAIMPLTRVGGKLGVRSAGGGAPVINIDARGAVEGTDVRIAKALRDALPGFTQTAVLATKQAAARGRL